VTRTLSVSSSIGITHLLYLPDVTPSIGLRAIEIGKAVNLCQLTTGKRLTIPSRHFRITSQMSSSPSNIMRCFGDDEVRFFFVASCQLVSLTPKYRACSGSQPAWGERDSSAVIRLQLLRQCPCDANHRSLSQVEQRQPIVLVCYIHHHR